MKHPFKIIGLAIVIVAIIVYVATDERSIHEHHPGEGHEGHEHLQPIPLEEQEEMVEEMEGEMKGDL